MFDRISLNYVQTFLPGIAYRRVRWPNESNNIYHRFGFRWHGRSSFTKMFSPFVVF